MLPELLLLLPELRYEPLDLEGDELLYEPLDLEGDELR
jgi:hypothetical protein